MRAIILITFLTLNSIVYSQNFDWSISAQGSLSIVDWSMDTDEKGNIYICGAFQGTFDFDPSPDNMNITSQGGNDFFIAKYDSSGNVIWANGLGGLDYVDCKSLAIKDDALYITGQFEGSVDFDPSLNDSTLTAVGSRDMYIAKYDTSGTFSWVKGIGSPQAEGAKKIGIDSDSNIVLIGSYTSQLDFDPSGAVYNLTPQGISDQFIAKYDFDGNLLWCNGLGGEKGLLDFDFDRSSNIIVTGFFEGTSDFDPSTNQLNLTSVDGRDIFLVKYNSDGDLVWGESFGGNSSDTGYSLICDSEDNVYLAGAFNDNIDTDPSTNSLVFNSAGGQTDSDGFLSKFDSLGNLIWSNQLGGFGNDYAVSLALGLNDNVFVGGRFYTSIDLDPSGGLDFQTATNGSEIFFAKFDRNGSYIWGESALGNGQNSIRDIVWNNFSSIYLLGNFRDLIDFDSNITSDNLSAVGNKDLFIAKYFSPCIETNSSMQISACDTFQSPSGLYTWNSSGVYNDTLINSYGCDSIITIDLTIHQSPTITLNSSNNNPCHGESIVIEGSGADTVIWTGGITNGVSFNITNSDVFHATGINSSGCIDTSSISIQVHEYPDVSLNSSDNTKCSGTCNGSVSTSVFNGTQPYSYSWIGNVGNQSGPDLTNLCSGWYVLEVSDNYDCETRDSIKINSQSTYDEEIFLTNLAAIDSGSISSAFDNYYSYNLPPNIEPNTSNPRNFVDPGKRARFKIESENQKFDGNSVVSGICKVRSNSPWINITDSSSAFNNIAWNDRRWSYDEFEVEIDPNTPPGTNAYLDFIVEENGVEYKTSCIALPIHPLDYSPTSPATIDDDNNPDSQGDNDDMVDPNETIEFYPWLDNKSSLDAQFVRGRLEDLDSSNYISIWDSIQGVNTVVYDVTWWNFSFGQPEMIPSQSINTTPEFDFVFDFTGNSSYTFDLELIVAGGFELFSSGALSLVQWSLPYTFNDNGTSNIDAAHGTLAGIELYPNPNNGSFTLQLPENSQFNEVIVLSMDGKVVYRNQVPNQESIQYELDLEKGVYVLNLTNSEQQTQKMFVVN